MDKLDYILRDQHFVFKHPVKTITTEAILEHALIVEEASGCTTIAFHRQNHVSDSIRNVFEARARLHHDVYQSGCVVATLRTVLAPSMLC